MEAICSTCQQPIEPTKETILVVETTPQPTIYAKCRSCKRWSVVFDHDTTSADRELFLANVDNESAEVVDEEFFAKTARTLKEYTIVIAVAVLMFLIFICWFVFA